MKCTSCGMPLSPSRANTSCPRCGAAAGVGQKSTGAANSPNPVFYEPPSWGGNGAGVPLGVGMSPQDGHWGQAGQLSSYNPSMGQAPVLQPGAINRVPTQAAQPGQMWLPGPTAQPGLSSNPITPQLRQPPRFPQPPRDNDRKTRIGFLVAGLCVVAGGLLLVFVYFMAIGAGNNSSGNTGTVTQTASSPTAAPSPTTTPSSTATAYPGQQFINNAQTSSTPPSGSQPGQAATIFKVNQKLYVSFNVHTGGQSGAICLVWYLNGKQAFTSNFAIGANTKFGYAYAIYGSPGPAYVELYWASNTTCANQQLAQHVDFTITT
jgi:hypothetical protein